MVSNAFDTYNLTDGVTVFALTDEAVDIFFEPRSPEWLDLSEEAETVIGAIIMKHIVPGIPKTLLWDKSWRAHDY